jgi:hypothetical protein
LLFSVVSHCSTRALRQRFAIFDRGGGAYLPTALAQALTVSASLKVDGVEMKRSLDFGAGVLNHRGLLKNGGA